MDDAKSQGEKPPFAGSDLAELLSDRYPLGASDRLTVAIPQGPLPALLLTLENKRDCYTIQVEYRRGADGRDRWMLLADALDALYGRFLEAGRAHRGLPSGSDVEFEGATFAVLAEHSIPELAQRADRLLGSS